MAGIEEGMSKEVADMRIVKVLILSVAVSASGASASKPAKPPFEGLWMSCERWQGSSICAYKALAQQGTRVCGVQSDFATNRYYVQRFVGTARGNVVEIDRICGDPGSETDTYCAGQAPADAAKVGWGASDRQLSLCEGRLQAGKKGEAAHCTPASARAAMPKTSGRDGEGPEAEDRAWMASCAQGDDG
ncbi:hypothetical protein LH19_07875 [Sphingopyxis macrogoltabida]|nr:hypothetical protein LH19_07875 [Sphingopyxis macrogoltabida]